MTAPLLIVQARMGSHRFPGKVLAPLNGKPVIWHVVQACRRTVVPFGWTGRTVVAIPKVADEHDPLAAYLRAASIEFMAVPGEDDVLGRYATVAAAHPEYDPIVRITADCPLVDHGTIVTLVREQQDSGCPYVARTMDPDGNDVEVFSRALLTEADAVSVDREHVTTWMRTRPGIRIMPTGRDLSRVKYSLDTVEDLRRCESLLNLRGEGAHWESYVDTYPTVAP